MKRLAQFAAIALLSVGCKTPAEPDAHAARSAAAEPPLPEAHVRLRELADERPRRGELVVSPETLHLNIRRGRHSSPFIELDRQSFGVGCWRELPTYTSAGHEEWSESDWWFFGNEEDAVALEFTAYDVGAWFWDATEECVVRVPALDGITFDDATPDDYYKADDAQIAFLFDYTFTDFDTGEMQFEVDGVREADIVDAVPGEEEFVVERGLVAIISASGRSLLQQEFEDTDRPCHNAQLTVFEEIGGDVYAIASLDTFGSEKSCDDADQTGRYVSVIAEWRPDEKRFEPTYRFVDEVVVYGPRNRESHAVVDRRYEVAGGTLLVRSRNASRNVERIGERCAERDGGSGVCLRREECWEFSSSDERVTRYSLTANDGVRFEVGEARSGHREEVDECE